MSRPHRVCVLVSGGLDSGVLVDQALGAGYRVTPLYVRCGLIWERAELHWLRRYLHAIRTPALAPLVVINLPMGSLYQTHWSITGRRVPTARSADQAMYLPGRNVFLLGAAAVICAQQRINTIAIGLLHHNPFGDASPRFLRRLARCLTEALDHPIRIVALLRGMTKPQVIQSARRIPFQLTFSCARPRGYQPCGRCNKCAERARAFAAASSTPRRAHKGP